MLNTVPIDALMDIFMLPLSLMMTYDLSNHTCLANYYLYELPRSKGQRLLPLNQPDDFEFQWLGTDLFPVSNLLQCNLYSSVETLGT